jgi:hypothetical protein
MIHSAKLSTGSCFGSCQSLPSKSFESNSHFTRIESDAFAVSSFETIVIPSQGDVLELDAVLVCTMSPCAQALPCEVSA